MPFRTRFAAQVRHYRRAHDWTQRALAARVGYAYSTISKVETGELQPSRQLAGDLARVLDLEADEARAFVALARLNRYAVHEQRPARTALPALALPTGSIGGLPTPPTPLIGRARETADAVSHLRRVDVRLLTLLGPGGIGKTRLGVAVAAALRPAYAAGVWFVDLAALMDPGLVVPAIAQALDVGSMGERPLLDTLIDVLRGEPLLLLLDSCEHVLEAATDVAQLLAACPALKALATSRAPLRLAAEHTLVVPPLTLPDPVADVALTDVAQSEAGALFIARAMAAQPDVPITAATAPAIAAICRRLDGLPLAIELAAARSTVLAPAALLARLDQRLPLLTGGVRDAPARQQTLRAAIDWSYALLSVPAQRLFARLGVFAGGCTLEAIEAICAGPDDAALAVLEHLQALVEQHLVRHVAAGDGPARYGMLDTLREYARESLASDSEREAVERRHAAYYLALAEAAEAGMHGPQQVTWLDRVEQEHGNLQAAFHWAHTQGEAELCLRLAAAQQWFWLGRGQLSEGVRVLESALALPGPVPPRVRATALLALSTLAICGASVPRLEAYRAEALALFGAAGDEQGSARALLALNRAAEALALCEQLGDREGSAYALWTLGHDAWDQGDLTQANAQLGQALARFQQLGHTGRVAHMVNELASVARDQADYARAETLLAEGLALSQAVRDHGLVAWNLHTWGELALLQGEYAAAQARLEQSIDLFRCQGNDAGIIFGLINLGYVAQRQGDVGQMAACLRESLHRSWHGHRDDLYSLGLAGMAAVAGVQGRVERAVRLFGAAEAQQARDSCAWCLAHRREIGRNRAAVQAQVDTATWRARWAEGQALPVAQVVAEALDALGDGMAQAVAAPGDTEASGEQSSYRPSARLTAREVEVLRLMAQGLRTGEVAATLGLSPLTVNVHLRAIYRKLGVRSRTAATRVAIEQQLV